MKSGNLNFLEPSWPLQAGNGTDCFTFIVHSENPDIQNRVFLSVNLTLSEEDWNTAKSRVS
jgi:hypothetical protein